MLEIDKEKDEVTFKLLLELCKTGVSNYKYISCCSYVDAIAFQEMGYDMRVNNLLLPKPSPFSPWVKKNKTIFPHIQWQCKRLKCS